MRPVAALLVVAALLGACSSPTPAARSNTEVRLDEFDITIDSPLAAGPVGLSVSNDGQFAHTLLVESPDGLVVSATDLIPPGATVEVDLDLPSGAYRVSCRIVVEDPDGGIIDHFQEGMRAGVAVVDG